MGRPIRSLNSDKRDEFETLGDFWQENGIRHIYIMPYKPQPNGIVERINITLVDMTRSMMARAYLPIHFWEETLSTSSYILNRVKIAKSLIA